MDIILQLIKKEELNHNYDISLFRVCHSLPPTDVLASCKLFFC